MNDEYTHLENNHSESPLPLHPMALQLLTWPSRVSHLGSKLGGCKSGSSQTPVEQPSLPVHCLTVYKVLSWTCEESWVSPPSQFTQEKTRPRGDFHTWLVQGQACSETLTTGQNPPGCPKLPLWLKQARSAQLTRGK